MLRRNAFERRLTESGLPPLTRSAVKTLQINLGGLCNQSCTHCHVDAGPSNRERMAPDTAAAVFQLLKRSPSVEVVDITGGSPELNENFIDLIVETRALGKRVTTQCNLTVLLLPKHESLPAFLALNQVEVVASLPGYTAENVDLQRGEGVFDKSIQALRLLNELGYAAEDSGLILNLVHNPPGACLPAFQAGLEQDYRERLRNDFGIEFNHLLAVNNMPIGRFAENLHKRGEYEDYMTLLVDSFDAERVKTLMCRDLVNVKWDGGLYDCDFNRAVDLPLAANGEPLNIRSVGSLSELGGLPVLTDDHCFGCTASNTTSCRGVRGGESDQGSATS